MKKETAPLHPGEVLLEELMKPLGISRNRLGRDPGVSPRRINEIVHGKRSVTADTSRQYVSLSIVSRDSSLLFPSAGKKRPEHGNQYQGGGG